MTVYIRNSSCIAAHLGRVVGKPVLKNVEYVKIMSYIESNSAQFHTCNDLRLGDMKFNTSGDKLMFSTERGNYAPDERFLYR